MSSLYNLTQDAMMLQEMFENGEINYKVLQDTLDAMGVTEKAENICKMIRNLEAKALAYKMEKDRLAKRQSECENGVARLKKTLLFHLTALDKSQMEAGLFKISKRSSTSVNITDESALDARFLEPQPPKVLRSEIAKALKEGLVDVKGAELVNSEYVSIR